MAQYQDTQTGRFYLGDTFEAMKEIPDGVVDMLLVDLPYGTTACKWDAVIPLEPLWEEYNRVCRKDAVMLFTSAQPFTTSLISSNIENYRYAWYWKKRPVNFLNAKKQPLRNIEDISVFCRTTPPYYPQGLVERLRKNKRSNSTETNGKHGNSNTSTHTNYPTQVIEITTGERGLHPTQKPVSLFEYLIRTYTNEGELVLDNTAGSGTTAIAAINAKRRWCCIERDEEYANAAIDRIKKHEAENGTTT